MINKTDLLVAMLERINDIDGVDQSEVDRFIKKKGLILRSEHKDFLIKCGKTESLLTSTFGNCTFNRFKKYNSNSEDYLDGDLPEGTIYFGHDFSDESLCIDNDTGHIYMTRVKLICYIIIMLKVFYFFDSSEKE